MLIYAVAATLAELVVLFFEPEISLAADNGLVSRGGLIVWVLATLVPLLLILACCARRMHDLGLSARWLWTLPILGGVVLAAIVFQDLPEDIRFAAAFDATMLSFLGLLALSYLLAILPGQRRENRFGPDPRVRHGQALEEVFR